MLLQFTNYLEFLTHRDFFRMQSWTNPKLDFWRPLLSQFRLQSWGKKTIRAKHCSKAKNDDRD